MTVSKSALALAALFQSRVKNLPISDCLSRSGISEAKTGMMAKAAVDPQSTSNSSALLQELWGDFNALLRDASVLPQLPGLRFDASQPINLPIGGGRGTLAGQWLEEGGAIPTASSSISTAKLEARRLKILSIFSQELSDRSIPEIGQIIQQQIVNDTSESLDSALLDSAARSAARPAGLLNATEVGADNIKAATAIVDLTDKIELLGAVSADVRGMMSRVVAVRAHRQGGSWLMSPNLMMWLGDLRDLSGNLVYPEIQSVAFRRHPVIESANVGDNTLFFVGAGALAIATGSPSLDLSTEAAIHLSTTPAADISEAAGADVRSMYQSAMLAIRMVHPTDWRVIRPGSIQALSGTSAWLG